MYEFVIQGEHSPGKMMELKSGKGNEPVNSKSNSNSGLAGVQ